MGNTRSKCGPPQKARWRRGQQGCQTGPHQRGVQEVQRPQPPPQGEPSAQFLFFSAEDTLKEGHIKCGHRENLGPLGWAVATREAPKSSARLGENSENAELKITSVSTSASTP